MNWILESTSYLGYPVVKSVDENQADLGPQKCGCCVVFATRKEAKELELSLLRTTQANIQAELAECENRIVTVMRELGVVNNSDNRRV